MEFCQLQINYLDWTLQNGKDKYDLLKKWNIPVWVMEPVRGGKLAKFDEETDDSLNAAKKLDKESKGEEPKESKKKKKFFQ